MQIFEGVYLYKEGIFYSLLLLLVLFILYFLFNFFRPSFVLPKSSLNKAKSRIKSFLLIGIVVIALLLPLNISWVKDKVFYKKKTLNIQVIFDVSLSMTADDIKPSRFQWAKDSVYNLVENLPWYNFSMISFSWIPFVWSPFSDATDAILTKIGNMSMWDFPPTRKFVGTAIWDSLILAVDNLMEASKKDEKPGIIILITDWDSNKWVDPLQAAKIAKSKDIPIYTLGIWRSDYLVWRDKFWGDVRTEINLDLLEDISKESWGTFYRVLSKKDFEDIFAEISNYVKSKEKINIQYEYWYLNNYLYIIFSLFVLMYISINMYSYFFKF